MIGWIVLISACTVEVHSEISSNNSLNACREVQTVGSFEIEWKTAIGNDQYISTPHCIDKYKMYVTRSCRNGILAAAPNCPNLQQPMSYCPSDLQLDDETESCYKILPRTTYVNSKCPYNYVKPFRAQDQKLDEAVWVHAKRNLDYGIGEFVYDELSDLLGTTLDIPKIYDGNITDCNCVAYRNGTFLAVPCNHKYKRVCLYDFLYDNNVHYCKANGFSCMGFNWDTSKLKCLCVRLGRNCSPAELLQVYQNSINKLAWSDSVIGLNATGTGVLWKTGLVPTYTLWAQRNIDLKDAAQEVFLTDEGWSTKASGNTGTICEDPFNYHEPLISLNKHGEDVLTLNVTFYSSLVKVNVRSSIAQEAVFCYSDSGVGSLFDRVNLQDVQIIGDNLFAKIETARSGAYWCDGFEVRGFSKISSKKMFIVKDNIYPLEITFKYHNGEDPTRKEAAYDKYVKSTEIILRNVSWVKTLGLNENFLQVKYLIHIHRPHTSLHLHYYKMVNKTLHRLQSKSKIVDHSQLYSQLYCMKLVEHFGNYTLSWNTTAANSTSHPKEICLSKTGRLINRKCNYDFYLGSRWSQHDQCYIFKRHPSNFTRKLRSLAQLRPSLDELESIVVKQSRVQRVDLFLVTNILEPYLAESTMGNADVTNRVLNCITMTCTKNLDVNNTVASKNIVIHTSQNAKGVALIRNAETYEIFHVQDSNHIFYHEELETAVIFPLLPEGLNVTIFVFIGASHPAMSLVDTDVVSNLLGVFPLQNTNSSYQVLFKKKGTAEGSACGVWSKDGWVVEGRSLHVTRKIYACEYSGGTYFSLLNRPQKEDDGVDIEIDDTASFELKVSTLTTMFISVALLLVVYHIRNKRKLKVEVVDEKNNEVGSKTPETHGAQLNCIVNLTTNTK